jgi:hypothetical protein
LRLGKFRLEKFIGDFFPPWRDSIFGYLLKEVLMGNIWVLDPTTNVAERPFILAPRPASLRNLRIGLVENTKYNSSDLLLKIAAILEKEYGAESHILRSKRSPGTPVDEKTIQEFKAAGDVAIAGIGD